MERVPFVTYFNMLTNISLSLSPPRQPPVSFESFEYIIGMARNKVLVVRRPPQPDRAGAADQGSVFALEDWTSLELDL